MFMFLVSAVNVFNENLVPMKISCGGSTGTLPPTSSTTSEYSKKATQIEPEGTRCTNKTNRF